MPTKRQELSDNFHYDAHRFFTSCFVKSGTEICCRLHYFIHMYPLCVASESLALSGVQNDVSKNSEFCKYHEQRLEYFAIEI